MSTEKDLAGRYLPVFMLDEREPFDMKAIGYTVFTENLRSDSFPKRVIGADWERTACVRSGLTMTSSTSTSWSMSGSTWERTEVCRGWKAASTEST